MAEYDPHAPPEEPVAYDPHAPPAEDEHVADAGDGGAGAGADESTSAPDAQPQQQAVYDPSMPAGDLLSHTEEAAEPEPEVEAEAPVEVADDNAPQPTEPSQEPSQDAEMPVDVNNDAAPETATGVEATAPSDTLSAPTTAAATPADAATAVPESVPAEATPVPEDPPAAAPTNGEQYDPGSYTTGMTNDSEPKVPLPAGVTDKSPSVVANQGLVRQWQQDPSNSTLILGLFNWAVQKTEIADARAWYEVLTVDSPTASQPLLALINLELALSNFSQVEDLFARALRAPTTLMAAADVNIWKAYLHYIRRQNPSDGPDADKARNTVNQAYEFALKECGVDREAGEIWQEYIAYLSEFKSKNPWDMQQQTDTIRKVYQRAVAIPLNNVEALWKAYDVFENGQNKQTAKKFLADRSPAYMTARTALREMRNLTDVLPHPMLPPVPDFSDDDRRVVSAWKAYLKWEEGNPLASDDPALVVTRMEYALRKCMAQMRHFPELWHYAATYSIGAGKADEGASFLKAGVAACPKSFLLTFALAELEEERKNYTECHSIFEALITRLNTEIEELKTTVAAEVEAARGPEIPVGAGTDVEMKDDDDVPRLVREREERGRLVQERRGKDIDEVKTAAGIVWVMYMRFARRAQGLKAARIVFGKARKSPHVTWHSFDASALMEYHSNKDSAVAVRIFELGLKQFSEDVTYVIKYLEFLLSINDDTNARALFERSALKIPADRARPLWEMWARFENMYGDLAAVQKLASRWAETFPNDSPLKRFAQRYAYEGIDEIALRDLGMAARARAAGPVHAQQGATALPPFPPRAGAGAQGAPSDSRLNSPLKRDRSPPRSPRPTADFKRARPASPAGVRRFEPAQSQGRFNPPLRERSPPPPPRVHAAHAQAPLAHAPHAAHPRAPVAPPAPLAAHLQYDRSGVPKPLAWFIGTLPTARSFDGPVFRAEDIIGLFGNIGPTGAAVAQAPVPAPRAGMARPPPRGFDPGFRGRRY